MKQQKMPRAWKIMLAVLIGCALMGWVDAVVRPAYFVKSAIKIALFTLLPLWCYGDAPAELRTIFANPKQGLVRGLLCGGGIFAVILGGYFAVRPYFDFSGITASLADGLGVSGDNFLLVAVYIALVNSFLEEFFFRGFAYLKLQTCLSPKLACGVSALAFALYHVAMMIGWFSPVLFALALAGLFVGGLIFNRLAQWSQSIYLSWLVHLCANLGQYRTTSPTAFFQNSTPCRCCENLKYDSITAFSRLGSA